MRATFVIGICVALGLSACGKSEESNRAPVLSSQSDNTTAAKLLFSAEDEPTLLRPEPFGSYAKGCLAGAEQLAETGPTWQAMRLSRNRNWGHPTAIDYIIDLSEKVARIPGWKGLYIGDISQPRGGPMFSGHASHQLGLDIDIWMRPPTRLNLSRSEREAISSISLRRSNGAHVNENWTPQHHQVMKAAAQDPRVARIFVFPGAKVKMCEEEKGGRAWLRKIRPWWGHHYHFHVRLACPRGAKRCVDQAPPPPGDGCDEARTWQRNILNPPAPKKPDPQKPTPKPKPKRALLLSDLPRQCQAVLQAK